MAVATARRLHSYLSSKNPLISMAPQNDTSPSPCEKCMSPIDRLAPSTKTGRYTLAAGTAGRAGSSAAWRQDARTLVYHDCTSAAACCKWCVSCLTHTDMHNACRTHHANGTARPACRCYQYRTTLSVNRITHGVEQQTKHAWLVLLISPLTPHSC